MPCAYCGHETTIDESHVVPKFMARYLKANSAAGFLLNSWKTKKALDLYVGPYLCSTCDNELFSSWENFYSRRVWNEPLDGSAPWTDTRTIKFLLSIMFRWAVHFMATSPIEDNRPYSECMSNLARTALLDHAHIGQSVFIYPYVHRAITNDCDLLPGVNHLLSLVVFAQSLPQEGDLPNAMLAIMPKVTVLFCDRDLAACQSNTMQQPRHLLVDGTFDAATANSDLPAFVASVLNRLINGTKVHQKQLGLWARFAYGVDKLANPEKMCYVAQAQDLSLMRWQIAHCRSR